MSWERHGGLRAAIAQQAAQIMYGEEVKQYFTAKRLAAKRLLGRAGARGLRHRPRDLPSNGEIKDALLDLVIEIEGDARRRRLFAMRIVALEAMDALSTFEPRLIGSVATGHVRAGSDVDLHVFASDPETIVAHVRALGWAHEVQRVSIMKQGKALEFTHVVVADLFPIELTVHAPRELRFRPRSSTDGKPIVRLKPAALRALLAREHADDWRAYRESGVAPSLDELLEADDDDAPSRADRLDDDDDAAAILDGDPFDDLDDDFHDSGDDDGDDWIDDDDARSSACDRTAGERRRARSEAQERAQLVRR